jgi:hypothetical protein
LGGLAQDPDLRRLERARVRHDPRPFSTGDCSQPGVLTLRGARRVGKTVALKLLVRRLIEEEGWEPRRIVWTALDTVRTLAQLEERLAHVATHRPRLVLVDEVTAVVGWQRVVKKLVDDGTLADACVILTGSSAHDLKAGAERMAGRRGTTSTPDRILLPLTFADFEAQRVDRGDVSSPEAEIQRVRAYLTCGGFPFRVEAYLDAQARGAPFDPQAQMQVFDDVVFFEIVRRRLDRSIALEVLGRLASIGASAISYEAFVKPLSVSRETARKYLDALGDAFLLATFSSYDTARGRVAPKKDKKLAWIDPALGFFAPFLRQGEAASEAARAEWAVGAALLGRYEARLFEGLSAPRQVFTWRSSGGNEVDYLVVDRSIRLQLPVEVKWQATIADWDFQIMERAFGRGWMVTPTTSRERPKSEALAFAAFARRLHRGREPEASR